MQERLLTRRFLSFTTSEVQWECMSLLECECGFRDQNRQHPPPYDLDHLLSADDRTAYNCWIKLIRI